MTSPTPPSRFARIRSLFLEALEQPAEAQSAFLDKACGEDQSLKEDVLSLLTHDQEDSPLDESFMNLGELLIDEEAQVPSQLGAFQVKEQIGHGGMAVVYRGIHQTTGAEVALKILKSGIMSRRSVQRFLLEAKILRLLHHPGIAQVLETGSFRSRGETRHFFVLELVRGENLMDYASNQELSLARKLKLFQELCQIVDFAHREGVIHRDLKPANVLVTAEGQVKVLDFGVARVTNAKLATTTMETTQGRIVGTLGYMSPEQCSGDRAVDPRSDVYSLGVMLYELLSGKPLFDFHGMSLTAAMNQIQKGPPRNLELPAGGQSRSLRGVIAKALHLDPSFRYDTAASFAEDLQRLSMGKPTTAGQTSFLRDVFFWASRRPTLAVGILGLVITLLSIAITATHIRHIASISYRISVSGQYDEVTLQDNLGNPLYKWKGGIRGSIVKAQLVQPWENQLDQAIILIGYHLHSTSDFPGRVCIYSATRPEVPLWTCSEQPLRPPEKPDAHPEAKVAMQDILLEDFFPHREGLEFAAIQSLNPFGATAIRIFDFTGRLLYQAWHDGALLSFYWIQNGGILLASGIESSATWKERGVHDLLDPYPRIVLALKIQERPVPPESWLMKNEQFQDKSLLWYKWFGPVKNLSNLSGLGVGLAPPQSPFPLENDAALLVRFSLPEIGPGRFLFSRTMNKEGLLSAKFVTPDIEMAEKKKLLPPLEEFKLLPLRELPPIQ
ncbi:MAG: serine/threonine protein kinase [Planctomycetota bacterium]|nr:MAG: serine/threonine protein kinase [Planctomycetota bacterium]